LLLAAPWIMPALSNPSCEFENSEHRRYLAELLIPRSSNLIDSDPNRVFAERYPQMEVLELIRYSHIFHPPRDDVKIAAGDLILVKGSANDLVEILDHEDVELPVSEAGLSFDAAKKEPIVVELIIPPQSAFLGKRLLQTDLKRDPDLHIIAIKRSDLHFTEKQIHDVKLRVGDIILAWCEVDKLERLREGFDFIVVEDVHHEIVHKRKAWKSILIFSGLIVAAGTGLADIMVCALTAAFLMIVTGCLQMRDAYRALQGDVLILIAGTIALGMAMQKTGTSRIYAEAFLGIFANFSPAFILAAVILLTSISTQILSNNATAVLLLPIAISTAVGLGVDPRPFVIAVCFGASACFATPIGYQTNLLVYGPAGYRFSDYLKLGIPLNLVVLVMGAILIPMVWPF
jgi:di/tricarboxylate transporter